MLQDDNDEEEEEEEEINEEDGYITFLANLRSCLRMSCDMSDESFARKLISISKTKTSQRSLWCQMPQVNISDVKQVKYDCTYIFIL